MKSPDCFFTLVLLMFAFGRAPGQDDAALPPLSLLEVVALAQRQSIAMRQAQTTLDIRSWEWKTFQSDLRPQLLLEGNLPDFIRAFQEVTQPNGAVEFQPVTINNSGLNLGLRQLLWATGGILFAGSTIQRFDDFERRRTLYSGQPISIGVSQPLFGFNLLRWSKKIEPLRYQESQRQFLFDRETIAREVASLFFDLLLAQVNLEMARANLANNDTILEIARERAALGKLSRNDLLQLQLAVLNARKDLAASMQDAEIALLRLRAYVGLRDDSALTLEAPEEAPFISVDERRALEEAWANRPEAAGLARRTLEAEREVARARGETGVNAMLNAAFGLNNRANQPGDLFRQAQDQQVVQLQFQVPILDWGRAASRRQTAKANQELVAASVEQDRLNFEQEVRTQVRLFNMLREQFFLARQADRIAQERYQIAVERYLLGDLSITDLHLALQEKDRARRDFVFGMRAFWEAYYGLRALTLYDFEKEQKIF
jgi:outer membrane protein